MAEIVPDSDLMTINEALLMLQKNTERMAIIRQQVRETSISLGRLCCYLAGTDQANLSAGEE